VKLAGTALERLAIVLASLALSIGLIAVLSGFFASHDPAGVSGNGGAAAGQQFPDLGHVHLSAGQPHPAYNSDPPTSGAHVPVNVSRDGTILTDDELLTALEIGDVVLMYGDKRPPPELRALARTVSAGPFTPVLAAAGQAVILARRPGTTGVIALAWTRMLRVKSVSDPALRQFAQQWLGRGAPGG
jgi:Protein of unknown function (DUF3105)